jgi:hypothetical protein
VVPMTRKVGMESGEVTGGTGGPPVSMFSRKTMPGRSNAQQVTWRMALVFSACRFKNFMASSVAAKTAGA